MIEHKYDIRPKWYSGSRKATREVILSLVISLAGRAWRRPPNRKETRKASRGLMSKDEGELRPSSQQPAIPPASLQPLPALPRVHPRHTIIHRRIYWESKMYPYKSWTFQEAAALRIQASWNTSRSSHLRTSLNQHDSPENSQKSQLKAQINERSKGTSTKGWQPAIFTPEFIWQESFVHFLKMVRLRQAGSGEGVIS